MKNCRLILLMAAAVAVTSSCNKAVVSGTFTSVPSDKHLVVKAVEGTQMKVLDTVKISSDGTFKYRADVVKGQPDFCYLYYGDTKVASLVLEAGDKVKVSCDTLGSWTVDGSPASESLREYEAKYSALMGKARITAKDFIEFYRYSVRYVMQNSHSLASVPALFAKLGNTAVFCQPSDGIIFNNVADSLESVYPQSKYIRNLRSEGNARQARLELETMLRNAGEASYIDLNFDGIDGKPVILSDLAEKNTTLLLFWDVTNAADKMFIKESIEPLYKKYAAKGLKIYSVGMGADKASWAMVVREQNMPWANVCDPAGRSIGAYSLSQTPSIIILDKGQIVKPAGSKLSDIQAELAKLL